MGDGKTLDPSCGSGYGRSEISRYLLPLGSRLRTRNWAGRMWADSRTTAQGGRRPADGEMEMNETKRFIANNPAPPNRPLSQSWWDELMEGTAWDPAMGWLDLFA